MSIGKCFNFRAHRRKKGGRQRFSGAPHAEGESVCKPGSVLSDHLSVALRCRSAQAASSERPGRPLCSSTALLRIEFTARTCLHAAGGRLSPPFHPYSAARKRQSGISLLHLSEGHPWRALPVILALWSPDFPHALPFGICPRSLGQLTNGIVTVPAAEVNIKIEFRGQ